MKLILSILILCSWIDSDKDDRIRFITQYKDFAIVEMQRVGIPASITLAQAILESNNGASSLATSANNYFGIKCKSYWQGETFYYHDDDYDKNGKLIKSCFRAYGSVLESFIDHSNFLQNNPHYNKLIYNKVTDYREWANAFDYYHYATDVHYGKKIISIIEKYELHRLDK